MSANCLISTIKQLNTARENRAVPPYAAAWAAFETLATPENSIERTVYDALRWSLLEDAEAAGRAVAALTTGTLYQPAAECIVALQSGFALAQAMTCLETYAPYQAVKTPVLAHWSGFVGALRAADNDAPHEGAWLALLRLCEGVLHGSVDGIAAGVAQVQALADKITAHGYIIGVVEAGNGSLERTIQTVQALCLAAEVAANIGHDLWGYERRGVSIMTAAVYPLYYYFYPEKWPWDSVIPFDPANPPKKKRRGKNAPTVEPEIDLEPTKALFRQHASFLEIMNLRAGGKIHAVTLILDDLRPITDLLGGGPVTLTHAVPPAPKRRGLFGR